MAFHSIIIFHFLSRRNKKNLCIDNNPERGRENECSDSVIIPLNETSRPNALPQVSQKEACIVMRSCLVIVILIMQNDWDNSQDEWGRGTLFFSSKGYHKYFAYKAMYSYGKEKSLSKPHTFVCRDLPFSVPWFLQTAKLTVANVWFGRIQESKFMHGQGLWGVGRALVLKRDKEQQLVNLLVTDLKKNQQYFNTYNFPFQGWS